MTTNPPTPSAATAWLSRIVGAALILEQSGGHLLGLPTDLRLLGLGAILLTGKEGWQYVSLILGRGSSVPSDGDSGRPS